MKPREPGHPFQTDRPNKKAPRVRGQCSFISNRGSERRAGVRQQPEEASPLDRLRDQPLLTGRSLDALAPVDLAVGRHQSAKVVNVLVVHERLAGWTLFENLDLGLGTETGETTHL